MCIKAQTRADYTGGFLWKRPAFVICLNKRCTWRVSHFSFATLAWSTADEELLCTHHPGARKTPKTRTASFCCTCYHKTSLWQQNSNVDQVDNKQPCLKVNALAWDLLSTNCLFTLKITDTKNLFFEQNCEAWFERTNDRANTIKRPHVRKRQQIIVALYAKTWDQLTCLPLIQSLGADQKAIAS